MTTLVSIIIAVHPNHNRADIVGACLDSIGKQTYPRNKFELILIGDGCQLNENLLPQGLKTKIYHFKNHAGFVKTRNKGIELSKIELVAFIDADCIAEKTWLENLVEGFTEDDIAGVGGKVLDLKYKSNHEDALYGNGYVLPFAGFCNAIFRRRILEEVRKLDEGLCLGGEDLDLSWRICLKGHRIGYAPKAIVVHQGTPHARDFFLFGIRTRNLAYKYKKIFTLPHPFNIRIYLKIITEHKFNIKELVTDMTRHLLVLGGYLYRLLKEKLNLFPASNQVSLTDQYLEPSWLIKPLAFKLNAQDLMKPNYIIWWKTEQGFKITDLKEKKQYSFEDLSAEIWKDLMERKSKGEMLNRLASEYEVDEKELEQDIDQFVSDLCRDKILTTCNAI